ncbi:ATP-binding response regulator [Variovorax guangxiensis]|uniref:histidine kinase n=1 Tax=Variovorax guangxiensis TaxID=1775474 RepID=A0A502DE14_9BURK|nr:hybrid sensor histidine kinase/response regulator [Variovorax guangxiensis]TPG20166.1 response regulator [Variovorax ginsengisoli]TPG23825.1 response regulator [Variovorax guangxiensis]
MTSSPAEPSPPSLARFHVQSEVLRMSTQPLGPVLIVQFLLNGGIAALFAWQYSLPRALLWMALIALVTLMRAFWPQRLPDALTPATLRHAQRVHTLRTAVWEIAHGAAGVLLFNPASAEQQLLLGLILMGMTLSSAFSVSFYVPATQLAITLLLAPVVVMGLAFGAPTMRAVAVIGIGLIAMMWKLVADHSRQLEENIALRHNERALREQALAGLHESQRAQAERLRFFSAANHDLRQPVMAMGLQAEVLRQQLRDGAPAHTVQGTVGALSRAQQALEGLTDQLLEIGRIEAAADTLTPCAVSLAPLLHEFARQEGSGRVRVRCPADAQAWSDPVALRRILGNLVDNALKFTPQGRVLLACRRRPGAWRIEVRDAGIGIPLDAQERVFGDFEQVGNVERNLQRGHGLGLAIVRRLAQRIGVQPTVRSAPGRGSVFGFEVAMPPHTAGGATPAFTVPPAMVLPVLPLRADIAVLVVEDNAVVAESLAALLRLWGARPRVYESAAEAMALADLHAIDVALCDIRLPGTIDGIALAERLQRQKPGLVIALISADIDEATQSLARDRGWHALRKPVNPAALKVVLRSAG